MTRTTQRGKHTPEGGEGEGGLQKALEAHVFARQQRALLAYARIDAAIAASLRTSVMCMNWHGSHATIFADRIYLR